MPCPLTLACASPGQHAAVSRAKLWQGYGVPLLGIREQLGDSVAERGLGGQAMTVEDVSGSKR